MKLFRILALGAIAAIAFTAVPEASAQNQIRRNNTESAPRPQKKRQVAVQPKPKGWQDHNNYVASSVPSYDQIEYNPNTSSALTPGQIGDTYFFGEDGKAQNYAVAAYYYRQAYDEGDYEAMVNLGYLYEKGLGVEQNTTYAAYYYYQAACQGIPTAEYNMGNCYYYGWGVGEDIAEARLWYQRAADHGYPKAAKRLKRLEALGK